MNIIVTGGAGYIGSHACKALAAAGYTPISFDNLVYGRPGAVRWGPLEVGDIADRNRLDALLQQYRPAAVMHFAAYAYVGESVQHPGKYYRNNVAGTLTLLEAMCDHGIKQLVFSSSCATYGIPRTEYIDESHSQDPINPYGASKLMVERMINDFSPAYGLRAIALRYFNAAGADPAVEIGENHDPETHLIPLTLMAAAGTGPALTVFGNDYATPDGTCIRDYIHVTDLAQAHVLALQALAEGAANRAYNLSNGRGFSVCEIISAAERVTGLPVPATYGPRRCGDPARLVGNAARIRTELGWQPRHASLEEILHTAWRWLQR